MLRAIAGFDWDAGNRRKCQKHGVSIAEIEMLFGSTPLVTPDLGHSQTEERHIAIGRTLSGRPVFVAFAYRIIGGAARIRPISARYMHGKEIDGYEKKSTQAQIGP